MHRPWLLIVTLVSASLLVGATEVDAKRVMVKPRPKPVPLVPEPPAPSDSGPAFEQGLAEVATDTSVANGSKPSVVEATATVWAQAGSRSWTGCSKVATEAGKQLFGYGEDVNNFSNDHHWSIQASECPNAPEVLTMAARAELLRRFDLPEALDDKTDLSLLEAEQAASRTRAIGWIDAAQAELRRRRDLQGLGLEYWRARALLANGEIEAAKQALQRGLREGSVEGWKLRRLLALTDLFAGNLDVALAHANRASIDAPQSDRLVSAYVLALVLDRAGDPASAARRMKAALDADGDGAQLRALELAMPIHERLYLRAYAKTVRLDAASALRLWDAYLARPQPEPPERRLAERHRSQLMPLPSNLGGLPHADEGTAASTRGGSP